MRNSGDDSIPAPEVLVGGNICLTVLFAQNQLLQGNPMMGLLGNPKLVPYNMGSGFGNAPGTMGPNPVYGGLGLMNSEQQMCVSLAMQMHWDQNNGQLANGGQQFPASLHSEKERADDSKREFAETLMAGEKRQKMLEEAEGKVRNLQDLLSRLEEKLANLESENQVLWQQAVSMAPNKFLSGRSKSMHRSMDGGHHLSGDAKTNACMSYDSQTGSSTLRELSEIEDKPQRLLNEKQQDILIRCIAQHHT